MKRTFTSIMASVLCILTALLLPISVHATACGVGILNTWDAQMTTVALYADEHIQDENILGHYYPGASATLLSDPNAKLVKVKIGTTIGFVDGQAFVHDTALIVSPSFSLLPEKIIKLKNPKSFINLRETASTKGKALGKYKDGQAIRVLGYTGDWCHIMIGEEIGYMPAAYLVDGDGASPVASGGTAGESQKPAPNEMRSYYFHTDRQGQQYNLSFAMDEQTPNTFAIYINVFYPEGWSKADDLEGFALCVNGKKITGILESGMYPEHGDRPFHFAATVEITDPIQTIRIVPNWPGAPEYAPEAVERTV